MSKNRRKSVAIALAVIGVAGLSLASASQLTVNSNNLQAGAATVGQCDTDGVDVSYGYSYDGTEYVADHVYVDGISDTCDSIGVTLSDGTNDVTLASTATNGATSFDSAISAIAVEKLSDVAVVLQSN